MIFEPEPGTSISLKDERIEFVPLEAEGRATVFVYAESGKEGTVYKVLKDQEFYALKVFYPEYRDKRLLENTIKLSRFKDLEGFRVAKRTIITRKSYPDIVAQYPELNYSVLMPWIEGTLWVNLQLTDDYIPHRHQCFQIIESLIRVVSKLEAQGLAHCDLSNNNFIIHPDFSSIELIDIEDMYAPDMPRPIPNISYGTPGYRTRWIAESGLWDSKSDRFSSAILCAEILTWHDKDVRKNRAGTASYFDEDEIGVNSERYRLVKQSLARESNNLSMLFESAWFSQKFDDCPPVADWLKGIEEIAQPAAKVASTPELEVPGDPPEIRNKTTRRKAPSTPAKIPPKMEINPVIIDFGVVQRSDAALEILISNTGGAVLTGAIRSVAWMDVSPDQFSLETGEEQSVIVSLNSELPRPQAGFEYRTPNALVVESNAGEEVLGATYRLAKLSTYRPQLGWLFVGLAVIALLSIYLPRTDKPSDLLHLLYFGTAGLVAGLATKAVRNFHNYQDILKAIVINGIVTVLSFVVFSLYTEHIATEIAWNSIFLILLMVAFAGAVNRDRVQMKPVAAVAPKPRKRNNTGRKVSTKTRRKVGTKGTQRKQTDSPAAASSVYVFADEGTALYTSLPASNNWIVWLEKGAELSVVEPLEDVISSFAKYGYYIEVIDRQGNRGFVTVTAIKLKYSERNHE